MKNFIFKLLILFIFIPEILFTCITEYSDCFNCSSCGTNNLEQCYCHWNSNSYSCNDINDIIYHQYKNYLSETFSQCIDSQSISIQEKYCGSSKILINKEYNVYMPKINNEYGTKSIYCNYEFILPDNDNIYYSINISNNQHYYDTTQLNLEVIYNNSSSNIYKIIYNEKLDDVFHDVKSIKISIYFEKGYSYNPFSIKIEEKNHSENNYNTLIIILCVVIGFFLFCGISCYLIKKNSQKERQRQHDLFERELARRNGEGIESEMEQRKNSEKMNIIKIKYILKNSLKYSPIDKFRMLKEAKICSICIERIKLKSRVSITSCNHIFHYDCLSTWLNKNILEPKCPNCNSNLIDNVDDVMVVNVKKYFEKKKVNSEGNNHEGNILRINKKFQIDKKSRGKESIGSRYTINNITNFNNSKREESKEENNSEN